MSPAVVTPGNVVAVTACAVFVGFVAYGLWCHPVRPALKHARDRWCGWCAERRADRRLAALDEVERKPPSVADREIVELERLINLPCAPDPRRLV